MNTPLPRWNPNKCAVFFRVKEKHGGLSNMAPGFPLVINGHPIRTSEALYQAMRFPNDPDVQRLILDQKSPMAAKMVGKPHLAKTRDDWDDVRVEIMMWTLRVKLVQNPETFGEVLRGTGELYIVEKSSKDQFWGAVEDPTTGELVGSNMLGALLRNLRGGWPLDYVPPLAIPTFHLLGEPIGKVTVGGSQVAECAYWKWDREHPRASPSENPHRTCNTCDACESYQEYVAQKMAGELG